ncbi:MULTISPECIES: putative mucin/carbohydrate-binding domain-containing protein [unclassified Enterococcus]|uniref:putative mucin/carbohydrate-binding domain-containing protein n=1 Tax=unclassified Enterococcus TaxID=2608891 RepID=UPI0013EE1F9F|nr:MULTISPECIES: putative mucin/carbohydrate-binding domain-containing protein [unclassified Enterococcus]
MKYKKIITTLMLSTCILGTLTPMVPTLAAENDQVVATTTNQTNLVPDDNLRKVLNCIFEKDKNSAITEEQLKSLTDITWPLTDGIICAKNVASLEGLQYCTALKNMNIDFTGTITDFSPLGSLLSHVNFKAWYGDQSYIYSDTKQTVEMNDNGTVSIGNPYKDENGQPMIPNEISNGGTYDQLTNKILWNNLDEKQQYCLEVHYARTISGTNNSALIVTANRKITVLNKQESVEQTIQLGGQELAKVPIAPRVSLTVKDHKATITKNSNYRFHFNGWKTSKYASIKLTDPNGNILYNQQWNGNQQVKGNYGPIASVDLPEGSTVEMFHAEGPWHRFETSDNDNLKTKLGKTGYTYTYTMQNNQLVLTNVQ